jgi:hypothetical protein
LGPVCKGFSGGKWQDQSEAYIGLANIFSTTSCKEDKVPGRINVQIPKNGVQTECASKDVFDKVTPKYLRYHPKLEWRKATVNTLTQYAINFKYPEKTFMIGRLNNTGFVIISKLELGDYRGFYYVLNGKGYIGTKGLEALTCQP